MTDYQITRFLKNYYYFVYMNVLPVCMSVYTCVPSA